MGDKDPQSEELGRASRRSFVRRLGTVGLATSAAVFGKTTAANASAYLCCNLMYPEPTIDTGSCQLSSCSYVWYCRFGGQQCICCEYRSCLSEIYTESAAAC